jgi:thiol:disulfide interchange protein DsbD
MSRPLLVCLFLSPLCSAQQNKLIVHPPDPATLKRGATAVQKLELSVLPGFHVNSDKPKDEFLIPLKLTWTAGPLEDQGVTYPKPEEIKVGNQMVTVYTGKFELETKFQVPANAPKGNAVMTGKLRYQACNNEMCFRPSTADVSLPVTIQ